MSDIKIACVGGGQLAQMLGSAAAPLRITIRSAGAIGSCAFSTCESFTDDLHDDNNFNNFLNGIDVFTFESEHEGLEYTDNISRRGVPIFPSPEFVEIAGDRHLEKTYLTQHSIPVAPFIDIEPTISTSALEKKLATVLDTHELSPHGIVIKTRHGGYDGKGQWVIRAGAGADLSSIVSEIMPVVKYPGCIIEGLVDFSMECSIIATRSRNGDIKTWPLTHNIHEDSILRQSYAPITHLANIDELEKQAIDIVTTICNESNYVGTIAVECFVTDNGLVVNEIAPRVHNSGHWTIEGSVTSQFEQHIRAVAGLDLGDTSMASGAEFVCMVNLIGRAIDSNAFSHLDGVHVHWYGKEVRPERKVGHITIAAASQAARDTVTKEVLAILDATA